MLIVEAVQGIILKVRFGSLPATEYTTWRVAGFGGKAAAQMPIATNPHFERLLSPIPAAQWQCHVGPLTANSSRSNSAEIRLYITAFSLFTGTARATQRIHIQTTKTTKTVAETCSANRACGTGSCRAVMTRIAGIVPTKKYGVR
jgi:hypothetical protein